MLKRSPKSKSTIAATWFIAILLGYIIFSSTLKIYNYSNSFGQRETFLILNKEVKRGDQIDLSDFTKREMFTNDVPNNSLKNIHEYKYFLLDLKPNTLITKNMLVKNFSEITTKDKRIVFIPSKEPLNENFSSKADLIATSEDGYSSFKVAEDVEILYGLTKNSKSNGDDKGFFVEVTPDEATDIVQAMSTNSVHFAIHGSKN
ncbi:MAG: hypothetical protein U0R17_05055 [Acidimicrobiia bacterium]